MNNSEKLYIVETALADNFITNEQKIQVAKQHDQLNIDTLLLSAENKSNAMQICKDVKNAKIVISCKPFQKDIDQVYEILKCASKPRIRLILSNDIISDLDLDNTQNKNDVIKLITDSINYSKKLIDDIELDIEYSAKKIHKIFLYKIIEAATEAKAQTITINGFIGTMLPFEIDTLIGEIFLNLPEMENTVIGISCNNKTGIATANTLTAIYKGARQADVSFALPNTESRGASLKHLLKLINNRKDCFRISTNLNVNEIKYLFPDLAKV